MSSHTVYTTIDSASFTPRDAVAKLEERMREGVQYPQLRGLVADWLERASQPAQFVTECIELIHEKISRIQTIVALRAMQIRGWLFSCCWTAFVVYRLRGRNVTERVLELQ